MNIFFFLDGLDGTRIKISLKRYALSMEDEMAAGGFGGAMNSGETAHLYCSI